MSLRTISIVILTSTLLLLINGCELIKQASMDDNTPGIGLKCLVDGFPMAATCVLSTANQTHNRLEGVLGLRPAGDGDRGRVGRAA